MCSIIIITIEGWEEISLLLRIKNRTLILKLKKIAYVLNFFLNIVSFACLKDKEYKWHYWLSKICNKKSCQIIGSILKQSNNYKIRNFEIDVKTVLLMLTMKSQSQYIIRHDDKKKK